MILSNQFLQQEFTFVTGCHKNVHNGTVDPELLFRTNVAQFYLPNNVNEQSMHTWCNEKPYAIQLVPLHSIKVGCGVL